MRTVDSSYVEMLYEHLQACGFNAERILGRLIDYGGRVPVSVWKKMLTDAQHITNQDLFGLRVAERMRFSHFGYLGYLLLNADSLLECLALSQDNTQLVSENNPTQIAFSEGAIDIHIPQIHGWVSQASDEVGLGAILRFLKLVTHQDIQPVRVEFVGAQPLNAADYEAYFKAEVRFGAEMPRLLLPMNTLQLPKAKPEPMQYKDVDEWVARRLQYVRKLTPELEAIRIQLLQLIRQGKTQLGDLAALRCCSIRTLQRVLEDQGVRFQQLLSDTRHGLAIEYLRDPRIALSDIADLLGYSSQAAFNRAFHQWTGRTPLAVRESQR
ncbi:MAG: AraC family transcriptional regulator ligand-binding domain-containing protein [Limnobacter sp.]|uniref:AraC family transcriptional regulator n=1 Tax=Limnobacter sp. TaxID=2003368 RepID=UPI00391D2961